ncbi:hypothetical protein ACFFX0_10075 [Citricoccus parietis]|uniref:Uncharacterized protein n=1 Tax=Citricoccus parietis TaxID=592307 RepID=A0ABV5FXZ0_9MICC
MHRFPTTLDTASPLNREDEAVRVVWMELRESTESTMSRPEMLLMVVE